MFSTQSDPVRTFRDFLGLGRVGEFEDSQNLHHKTGGFVAHCSPSLKANPSQLYFKRKIHMILRERNQRKSTAKFVDPRCFFFFALLKGKSIFKAIHLRQMQ
jgi:hypothetical protein